MRLIAEALALAVAALPVSAQTGHGSHAGHAAHGGHAGHDATEPTDGLAAEWNAINDRMHGAMAVEFTGDVDVDFVRGMIPHHEGVVEMARLVLEHGEDVEVRELALEVIAAQEAEIAWMRDWLAARGY